MYKKLRNLTALMMASFATDMEASAIPADSKLKDSQDKTLVPSILNLSIPTHLAAHRSHSSHGSHRSHRSSSGGGGYSTPSYPSTPSAPRKSKPAPSPKKSDPLGQPEKPASSYPPKTNKSLAEKLKNKELRKNIIMRMQLTLQFEGLYKGPINGVMDQTTRQAVKQYKKAKGLPGDKIFDAATLNAMGIKVD